MHISRQRLGFVFVRAACVYWFQVFPRIAGEVKSWRRYARGIPDESLRSAALAVQDTKRANLEGAAAFAAFVPRAHRAAVIRAQVTLQGIYDYVDTLAEQPSQDPIRNSHQLHQALPAALEPYVSHSHYYVHHQHARDAGYLKGMIEACRTAQSTLPSRAVITASAHRFAKRIITYQALNIPSKPAGKALKCWASSETPRHLDLRWWETAASAGSSLGIFVLFALAAEPRATLTDAHAIEHAYFPWVGALHSLLDSLVDIDEDIAAGQPNLIAHYASTDETATRMQFLADESLRCMKRLPKATSHILILASMVSVYLSAPEAWLPSAQPVTEEVLNVFGNITKLTLFMLRVRGWLGNLNGPRGAVVRVRTSPETHLLPSQDLAGNMAVGDGWCAHTNPFWAFTNGSTSLRLGLQWRQPEHRG